MGLDELNRRSSSGEGFSSREYQKYKEAEEEGKGSLYERIAHSLGNVKEIDISSFPLMEEKSKQMQKDLQTARMKAEPEEIGAMLAIPLIILVGTLFVLSFLLPLVMLLFLWTLPFFWGFWVISYPGFQATVTRIRSSDEALRVILYMAMQLEMSPSLENAVKSAAEHSNGPISRDLQKILWDTETRKFSTLKEGLSEYMKLWREWSPDFTKSMEFLLDATSRSGEDRKNMIQKGQENILDATKKKMEGYSRSLSSPVKVIHMAGIVLPLMGLIMFPMVTIFMGGETTVGSVTGFIAFGYLIALPLFLFFLVKRLISQRPGAYSHPSLENVRDLPPKDVLQVDAFGSKYYLPLKTLAFTIGFIIMIPGIVHFADIFSAILSQNTGISIGQEVVTPEQWSNFIDQQYKVDNLIPNVLQALSVIWGISVGLMIYFFGRSYRRKKIREQIEEIEEDLNVSLTELENALSKQVPIERAIYSAVEGLQNMGKTESPIYKFFTAVLNRIESMGHRFKQAVFGKDGAIADFPSSLLRNSMKVISNTATRGSQAIAQTVRTVSEYIKNTKDIEDTIKKLLSEVVDQMKMLAKFIAPIITGAAASMSILIVEILFAVSQQLENVEEQLNLGGGQAIGSMTEQLSLVKSIDSSLPPTVLLLIVGLYLIEIALILGYFTSGIKDGFDEINRDLELGSTLIYAIVVFSILVIVSSAYVTPLIVDLTSV